MICIIHNVFLLKAEGKSETVIILATQEVEDETTLLIESTELLKGASIYYNEAKGWVFNDIIYMDGCATYQSSYGGNPSGMLSPGYYRFVKSNGSYVALCAVDLVSDGTVRSEYAELWQKYGGMWSWEQAFYNQLDGTPELKNPTDIKRAVLENGKIVMDETQNYRFIKCWIKIEDLRENPNPDKSSYKQIVRYFIRDPKSGEETEIKSLGREEYAEEKTRYEVTLEEIEGYEVKEVKVNGIKKEGPDYSYTVLQENEICVYYTPHKAVMRFHANDGSGQVEVRTYYFPEERVCLEQMFCMEEATFLGWSLSVLDDTVTYCDGEELALNLKTSNVALDLYGVWDFAPEVILPDLYFSKMELLSKVDIGKYIVSFCTLSDEEDENFGTAKPVTFLTDLKQEIKAISEGWISYCIKVEDNAGNTVEKWGRFYVIDVWPQKLGSQKDEFRFISAEYLETLSEDSIWLTDPLYHRMLVQCLQKETGIRWKKTPYGWQIQM